MNFTFDAYETGYTEGRREVFCDLICHGFDERLLQRIFSISEDELYSIVAEANNAIREIKNATQFNTR